MRKIRFTKESVYLSGQLAKIKVHYNYKGKPVLLAEEKIGFNIVCASNRAGIQLLNFFHAIGEIEEDKKENRLDCLKDNREDLKEMFYTMGYDDYKVCGSFPFYDRDIKTKIETLFQEAMK